MGRKKEKYLSPVFVSTSTMGTGEVRMIIEHHLRQTATVERLIAQAIVGTGGLTEIHGRVVEGHEGLPTVCVVFEDFSIRCPWAEFNNLVSAVYARNETKGHAESKSHRFSEAQVPPRGARFVLLLIPQRSREHLIGDLEEEYTTVVLPEYGPFRAGLWFWAQTLWALGPYLWVGFKRVLGWAAILKIIGM